MANIILRNNVKVSGEGSQTILFAHGFIGDQTLWRHVVGEFEKKFRVILFDYVGSGASDKSAYDKTKYSRLEGYADDLNEICDALKLSNTVFVGHSISGIIGLIAAFRGANFSKMILVAPSPRYINDEKYYGGFEKQDVEKIVEKIEYDYANWAQELAPMVINKPSAPELSDELIQKLLATDHRVALNFAKATFFVDYRKELLKFKVPTLILQCQQDVMAPLEVGDYLQAHLDNCQLQRLEARGHFPQLSAPEEVIQAITNFIGVGGSPDFNK